jgi:hypothetical protein
MTATQQVLASPIAIVQRVIDCWESDAAIEAAEVADLAYLEPEVDPEEIAPVLVKHLAKMQLRSIAGKICATKFGLNDEITEQHDLFPDLQKKYPQAHKPGANPRYIPLEKMETEDFSWNIGHLRSSARTRLHHADVLEQFAISQGKL